MLQMRRDRVAATAGFLPPPRLQTASSSERPQKVDDHCECSSLPGVKGQASLGSILVEGQYSIYGDCTSYEKTKGCSSATKTTSARRGGTAGNCHGLIAAPESGVNDDQR